MPAPTAFGHTAAVQVQQILEGPEGPLMKLFEKIKNDSRHEIFEVEVKE